MLVNSFISGRKKKRCLNTCWGGREEFTGDLKISFSKYNIIKILCNFRFPELYSNTVLPCTDTHKDVHLQTLKSICVLVAVDLKKVHNLVKEMLKNRRNVCFFSKAGKDFIT